MCVLKIKNKQHGFTVVEIAIVLLISSFLLSMFLTVYSTYQDKRRDGVTIDHIEILDGVLKEYLAAFGRYPCPADPTLNPGHPDYGVSTICGPNSGLPSCTTQNPSLPTSLAISNVLCLNAGGRDVDGDGNDEFALIGTFPFRTIQALKDSVTADIYSDFTEAVSFDGHNMRFSYAVTEIMADTGLSLDNPANPFQGAISIMDENNREVTNTDNTVPVPGNGLAHYVLISHGADMKGAYNVEGNRTDECFVSVLGGPLGGAPAGADDVNDPDFGGTMDLQNENCDNNDAIFRKAIRSDRDDTTAYFDDVVFFKSNYETSLWRVANNSAQGERYLYNANLGNVGVGDGFMAPSSKLHVDGDVFVANQIRAQEGYCDTALAVRDPASVAPLPPPTDWSECMDVAFIAGAGDDCGVGEVAVAIDRNQLICEPVFNTGSPVVPPTYDAASLDCTSSSNALIGIRYDRSANTIFGICG